MAIWSVCVVLGEKERKTERVLFKGVARKIRDIETRYEKYIEEGNLKVHQTNHMKKEGSVKRSNISLQHTTAEDVLLDTRWYKEALPCPGAMGFCLLREKEITKEREDLIYSQSTRTRTFHKSHEGKDNAWRVEQNKTRQNKDRAQREKYIRNDPTDKKKDTASHQRQTQLQKSNLILKPCDWGCKQLD